jgi:hypothetical protein
MSDHEDLRQLFSDATSDIRPQGSLDDILDRTKKVDPMARRWFLPVVAAAAVIGFVIGGAVWIANDSNTPDHGPSTTPTSNPTSGNDGVFAQVPVYYPGRTAHATKLYRETQRIQVCAESPDCVLAASARLAVAGAPNDPDYLNPWPDGTTVKSALWDGNMITVDLHATSPMVTGSTSTWSPEERLAVQGLIYSVQAGLGQGRVPVQLIVDDVKVRTVMGVSTDGPLQAEDADKVLAPVQISTPGNGETVPAGDVKVTGVAMAFEANVLWEVLVGGDAVIAQGHASAKECCTLSPYEFTIKNLQPGTYTLVVHDEDMSGEGRPVNQDTKEIVVE